MSNDLDSTSIQDLHGVPWRHAACFRSWRAGVLFGEQIINMNAPTFAAFVYHYNVGNRAARPRVHLDLEDIESVAERVDGWRLIGPEMGSQASVIDPELPLMENGTEAGLVMRWQDREGDLWGDVLWRKEGEEHATYENRQGQWKISAILTDLGKAMPNGGTLNMPGGALTFGGANDGATPEDVTSGPRMATAGHEGDGGVPWAS